MPSWHRRKLDAPMKTQDAHALGQSIATLIQEDQLNQAFALLAPILAERTSFTLLRCIGREIGHIPLAHLDPFLARIAGTKTEGGWPVISGVLAAQLGQNLSGSLGRCRTFIREAGVWYAADTLGEWVVGQALVDYFQPTLDLLPPWREDANGWVRRAVGTSVHMWAKRSRGSEVLVQEAETLLSFLEPLFEERETAAVKGVGWGLKTLGKYYPDLLSTWLEKQVVQRQRPYRTLMLRKAMAYLPQARKNQITGNITQ
jgi:3-methyladenine DNA glycosylase AlkD